MSETVKPTPNTAPAAAAPSEHDTDAQIRAGLADEELVASPIQVRVGRWWWVCPICGADWRDGEAWIAAAGPPCEHLKIYVERSPEGNTVYRYMRVDRFAKWRRRARALWHWIALTDPRDSRDPNKYERRDWP